MASVTTLTTAARNAACTASVELLDADASPGYVEILDGASVLVTITLDDPAFGAPATGVATANNLPLVGTATASGTADTWKAYDGAGTQVMSGNVGTTDESMILDSVTITSGNAYAITSWTHTQPA